MTIRLKQLWYSSCEVCLMDHANTMPVYTAQKCTICHSAEALGVLFLSLCANNWKKRNSQHDIKQIFINSRTPGHDIFIGAKLLGDTKGHTQT